MISEGSPSLVNARVVGDRIMAHAEDSEKAVDKSGSVSGEPLELHN